MAFTIHRLLVDISFDTLELRGLWQTRLSHFFVKMPKEKLSHHSRLVLKSKKCSESLLVAFLIHNLIQIFIEN